MTTIQKNIFLFLVLALLSVNTTCRAQTSSVADSNVEKKEGKQKKRKKKYRLPKIDLNHWKVTVPAGTGKGGALSVAPPEILEYATNELLLPYMYNDSTSGALTFYAYPSNSTTANTKYSRSELREQIVPGDDDANWTFIQGGKMRVKMAMGEVSKDEKGKYHKVIIAQIHGRLTDAQRDRIGQKDNNAPPILKIHWQDGKIRVKTKVLKNLGVSSEGILHEEAWGDDKGYTFDKKVDFKKFILEIVVTKGKMVISLNNEEFAVYENTSIKRWGIFENYFKVGNYFQTRDEGAFAKVKIYDLEVSH